MSKPRSAQYIHAQLDRLAEPIARGSKVLLLNLVGDSIQAQFIEPQLRVQLQDPTLHVRVLTVMVAQGAMGATLEVAREGENALVVRGGRIAGMSRDFPVLEHMREPFPWIALDTGTVVEREALGFSVEILQGRGTRCEELRFVFPEPLRSYTILRFHPDPDARKPPWVRSFSGWVERVKL